MTHAPTPHLRALPVDAPRLFATLDRVATEHPLDRKVLVAPARGAGRELLRTLARMRGGWTGFAVETPRPLALQLATPALARAGRRVVDQFEEEALVDAALDRALEGDAVPVRQRDRYRTLAAGRGFRQAVRGSVVALRLGGVDAGRVRQAPFRDAGKQALLAAVLAAYADALDAAGGVDVAHVLELATRALRDGAPLPGRARVYLLPGLSRRGASGRFLQELVDQGAAVLATDAVVGLPVPEGMLWSAGAPSAPFGYLHAPGALETAGSQDATRDATRDAGIVEPAPRPGGSRAGALTEGLPLFDALNDPERAAEQPAIHLFRAAGVQEELREVLRRVMASRRRLDDVEIITPDAGVYGPALHALATRLGLEVTFAVGLPVERTRPGRAVAAWLRWIGNDFPSPELRRLLENDDLRAPGRHRRVNPRRLARRLRRLRIGWGRERYLRLVDAALDRLERDPPGPRHDESPEELGRRLERTREELEALRALATYLMRHAPNAIPRRLELEPRPLAPSDLARGLAGFLRLVPVSAGSVDATARERLLRVLDRIVATLDRPVSFGAARGILEDHLDLRVPAPRAEGRAPWLSDGGGIHLSDLDHGGLSGRPLTFLVGLDAGRFPGGDAQDPLLLDGERRMLSAALPTAGDRLDEKQFRLAALLARLRGEVVLSYAAWDAVEARSVAPSPVLLQAYRLATGRVDEGFEALHEHLGTPASRLPRGSTALDREDVWLGALSTRDHLLEGTDQVRAAFPRLATGLDARGAWRGEAAGPHHGLVRARPTFDARGRDDAVLSASRLQTLAECPLRYFYRYVLRVAPPDDPTFQPDAWLDALARGGLLHRLYERLLRDARAADLSPDDPAFVELGRRILEDEARTLRHELPPPSEAVFERELVALDDDVRCFAHYLRQHPAPWVELERAFGMSGAADPPVALEIGGGTVRLRGAVDRIDRVGVAGGAESSTEAGAAPDTHALRIVDYKTGRFNRLWASGTGIWRGGRRLQHLLYALAVEALTGRPVEVMEYHFPTRKGEGRIAAFERHRLRGGEDLVARLLHIARQGRFLPTDSADDCTFCDYRAVCRVTSRNWGKLDSPPARWGAARCEAGDAVYEDLRAVRAFEDEP